MISPLTAIILTATTAALYLIAGLLGSRGYLGERATMTAYLAISVGAFLFCTYIHSWQGTLVTGAFSGVFVWAVIIAQAPGEDTAP